MNNTVLKLVNGANATGSDTQPACFQGTGYYDPNGVFHCPSNTAPTCPAGQVVQGNYVGELICAPASCPAGTHMGWNTQGTRVICSPNDTPVVIDTNPVITPITTAGGSLLNYAKANPLLAGAVIFGAYYLLKKKR